LSGRRLRHVLKQRPSEQAAVVLLGPRQSGKTTQAQVLVEVGRRSPT
jgi:predicted AAA+ superfamily ATPase